MEKRPIQLLLLEDSEQDAHRLIEKIEQSGFAVAFERAFTKQQMLNVLAEGRDWDLIISEHQMPGFTSTDVLLALHGRRADIPLVIVSDNIGEEVAIETVRAGAHDFVMKDDLSRLGVTINNALHAAKVREEAKAYQQRLRELSMHLEEVREAERVSIAREVHDELGGMLTAVKMDVRWLHKKCRESTCDTEDKFERLAEHLDSAINTVRRIITDLRPSVLDDLGLVAALEWQLNEFASRYEVDSRFDCDLPNLEGIEQSQAVAVFRIFQESLTNIAKHAKASTVAVSASVDENRLLLIINDNGIGISEENKLKTGHYGILGMHERALSIGGGLEVKTGATGGTQVTLKLPLGYEVKQE